MNQQRRDVAPSVSQAIPNRVQPASRLPRDPVQWLVLAVGLAVLGTGVIRLSMDSPRLATLLFIGALLGVSLYHGAFGFASAYRRMFTARDTGGVQAQLLMLAAATLLFAPVLAAGTVFGHDVGGTAAPLGVQVVAGAFMFGIGMQLGNGCGSGTLYTLGGGSTRMLATLAAFVTGSFIATLQWDWWQSLPAAPAVVLGDAVGWPLGIAVQLAWLFVLWRVLKHWGRPARASVNGHAGWHTLVRGPWPPWAAALALALLNFATLLVAGHPWTITWAFSLWGAETAMLFGWNPATSVFWDGGFPQAALDGGVFQDVTSIMDFGLVIGAFCAAALAGRFRPALQLPLRSLAAALIGGLLMGYGARIAFGCNVGAFFSGVASTSLHGWLWIAAALPGTWLGIRLRPHFGLAN